MSFIEEILKTVQCDNCKVHYEDENSGYGFWINEQDAWECANNDGWTEENNMHYCNDCYVYDNNDKLILKLIQTRLSNETQKGNCFPTVIACLMGLKNPEEVIQIQEYYNVENNSWIDKLYEWLGQKGFFHEYIDDHLLNDEFYLVSGNTSRNIMHICIYQNGKLWHDPHPSKEGLLSENSFAVINRVVKKEM